jgi:hypothetical protein
MPAGYGPQGYPQQAPAGYGYGQSYGNYPNRRPSGGNGVMIGAVVLILILVGGLGFLLWKKSQVVEVPPGTPPPLQDSTKALLDKLDKQGR